MPEEDELGFDSVEGLGDLDSSDDDGKDVETKINVSDSVVVLLLSIYFTFSGLAKSWTNHQ